MRINIVQELTGRVMEIVLEMETDHFGAEVLKYNEVEGLIGPQIRRIDKESRYVYEVGSMITLSELFDKKQMTLDEFEEIMEQMIQIFHQAREYFLDERDIVLMADYMFYDEWEKKLMAGYLDGYQGDVAEEISKILECFMDRMNHHDKELVFLIYGLHRISKDSHFTLNSLTEFVQESRQKRKAGEKKKKMESVENHQMEIPDRIIVEEKRTAQKPLKEEKKKVNYTKVLLFLVAGLAVFAAIVKSGILYRPVSGEMDMVKLAVVVLLLVAGEAYVIGKELNLSDPEKETVTMFRDERTTKLLPDDLDETVVLEQADTPRLLVNLIPQDWQRQEIKIRKSPFFIGKDTTKAEGIIGEAEISRIHAKIVMEEGSVYMIDQESTNGTYINGAQAVPWERCRLQDGDWIGFSSVFYTVEIVS